MEANGYAILKARYMDAMRAGDTVRMMLLLRELVAEQAKK